MKAIESTRDLGMIKNLTVIQQNLNLAGKQVLDAGCGNLTFSTLLAGLGANVIGIDPDSVQAELNRQADLPPNLRFIEAGADDIPLRNESLDGVFFSYSLHHVPEKMFPKVFAEMRRVLKPNGFLYVLEPTDCPLNQVMKLFHDEDHVRAAAQSAIAEFAAPFFEKIDAFTYFDYRQFESFDDFASQFASKSFNPLYCEDNVRNSRVREAFEKYGTPDYIFQSPKKVVFLSQLKQ